MIHIPEDNFSPEGSYCLAPSTINEINLGKPFSPVYLRSNQAFLSEFLEAPHNVLSENIKITLSAIEDLLNQSYQTLTIKGPSLTHFTSMTTPSEFSEYYTAYTPSKNLPTQGILREARDALSVEILQDIPSSQTVKLIQASGEANIVNTNHPGPFYAGTIIRRLTGFTILDYELLDGIYGPSVDLYQDTEETVATVRHTNTGLSINIIPNRYYKILVNRNYQGIYYDSNIKYAGTYCSQQEANSNFSIASGYINVNSPDGYILFSDRASGGPYGINPSNRTLLTTGQWTSLDYSILPSEVSYDYILTGPSDTELEAGGERVLLPKNGVYALLPLDEISPLAQGAIPRSFINNLKKYGKITIAGTNTICTTRSIPTEEDAILETGFRFDYYTRQDQRDSQINYTENLYFQAIDATEDTHYLTDGLKFYSSFSDKYHNHDNRYFKRFEVIPKTNALGGFSAEEFSMLDHDHEEFLRLEVPAVDTMYLQQMTSSDFARVGHEHPGEFYTNGMTPEELNVFLSSGKDFESYSVPGCYRNLYKNLSGSPEYWEDPKNPLMFYFDETGYLDNASIVIAVEPKDSYSEAYTLAEIIIDIVKPLYTLHKSIQITCQNRYIEAATILDNLDTLTRFIEYSGSTSPSIWSGYPNVETFFNGVHTIPAGKAHLIMLFNSSISDTPITLSKLPYLHYWVLPTGPSWEAVTYLALKRAVVKAGVPEGNFHRHAIVTSDDSDDFVRAITSEIPTTTFGQKVAADPEVSYKLVKAGMQITLTQDSEGVFRNVPIVAYPRDWILETSFVSFPVMHRDQTPEPSWECTPTGCLYKDTRYGEYLSLHECQVSCNIKNLDHIGYPTPGWGEVVDDTDTLLDGPSGEEAGYCKDDDKTPPTYLELKSQFFPNYFTAESLATRDHLHESLYYNRKEKVMRSWGISAKYFSETGEDSFLESLPPEERNLYKDGVITPNEIAKRYHTHPFYAQTEAADAIFYKKEDTVRSSQLFQNRNLYLLMVDIERSALDYRSATSPLSLSSFTNTRKTSSDYYIERFSTAFATEIPDLAGFVWTYYQDICSLNSNGNDDIYYPEDLPINWSTSIVSRLEGVRTPGYAGLTAVSPIPTFTSDRNTLNSRSIMALGWSNKYPEGINAMEAMTREAISEDPLNVYGNSMQTFKVATSRKYVSTQNKIAGSLQVDLMRDTPSYLEVTLEDGILPGVPVKITGEGTIRTLEGETSWDFTGKDRFYTPPYIYRINLPRQITLGYSSTFTGVLFVTGGATEIRKEFYFTNLPDYTVISADIDIQVIDTPRSSISQQVTINPRSVALDKPDPFIDEYGEFIVEMEEI